LDKKGEKVNKEVCLREHADFVQAYQENGVEVVLMDPTPGLRSVLTVQLQDS
jgi:N-dimethylarginine dimethylaminohydrolase